NVWPKTTDFRFVLEQTSILASPDSMMATVIAPWTSTGYHPDGNPFPRPGRGLRHAALDHAPHHRLSTFRRQSRILMGVHSVLPRNSEASPTSASSVRAEWTTS